MTTIPPTLPPAPAPAAPQAVVTATPVSDVPAQIASLPPSSTIEATVVAAAQALAQAQARAVVQLATALGNFTVRLPMPVPPNATLRLQVMGAGANLQLRVIALNGQALPGGPAPNLAEIGSPALPPLAGPLSDQASSAQGTGAAGLPPQPGTPAAAGAAASETLPSLNPGSGLTATIVFGTEPALPNGTQLTVRLLNIAPPIAGGSSTLPLPGAPGASVFPSPAPLGQLPAAPSAAGPVGGALPPQPGTATPAGVAAPGPTAPGGVPPTTPLSAGGPGQTAAPSSGPIPAQSPSPAPSPLPAALPGLVAPNSLGGLPLIQTPVGLISLSGGPDLPPGSRLTLETVGAPTPPAASPAAAQPSQIGPTGWGTFGDAMAVLQRADPAAAQLLVQRLPDLGPQFVPNMVTWMAAAQNGDMRAWLGERTVKALEKAGRADLIEKLDSDMEGMRVPVTVPQMDSKWMALTVPLFFGQRVERIRLTMRRPEGEAGTAAAGRDEEGLRFLVDVDMSRLGALQLDGLVKRQAKHFDLIVRSHSALPETVRRDINGIFTRSLEGLGMTGGAVFKEAVAFVEPIPVQAGRAGLTI